MMNNGKCEINTKKARCGKEIKEAEDAGLKTINILIHVDSGNVKHSIIGVLLAAAKSLYAMAPTKEEGDEILFKVRDIAMVTRKEWKEYKTKKKGVKK